MPVMNQLDASEVERKLTDWLQRLHPASSAAVTPVSIPQGSGGIGAEFPPGFPSEAEIISRYQELTGHEVRHLHYYDVLSCFRLSVMMVHVADL